MAGLLRGPKISGRHQTYIQSAKSVIQLAQKAEFITKIVIGPIDNIHSKSRKKKVTITPSSVQVDIYAGNEKQILWLIGDLAAIASWVEKLQH